MRGQARWSDALLAAAASWAAMLPIQTLLRSLAWVNPALLITAIVVVTGVLARTVLRNWLAVAAVQLLVGVESIVLMYAATRRGTACPLGHGVGAQRHPSRRARRFRRLSPRPTTPGIVLTPRCSRSSWCWPSTLCREPPVTGRRRLASSVPIRRRGELEFDAAWIPPAAGRPVAADAGPRGTVGLRRCPVLPRTPRARPDRPTPCLLRPYRRRARLGPAIGACWRPSSTSTRYRRRAGAHDRPRRRHRHPEHDTRPAGQPENPSARRCCGIARVSARRRRLGGGPRAIGPTAPGSASGTQREQG